MLWADFWQLLGGYILYVDQRFLGFDRAEGAKMRFMYKTLKIQAQSSSESWSAMTVVSFPSALWATSVIRPPLAPPSPPLRAVLSSLFLVLAWRPAVTRNPPSLPWSKSLNGLHQRKNRSIKQVMSGTPLRYPRRHFKITLMPQPIKANPSPSRRQ